MQNHKELNAYIERLGLGYSAVFIPQSKSRNAGEKQPLLNWSVSISKGTHSSQQLTTDYMQGIGHVPGYYQGGDDNGGWKTKYYKKVAETGKYQTRIPKFSNGQMDYYSAHEERGYTRLGEKPLPVPLLRDVLHSLVGDSDVLNYESFESWASEFGYDTDSRKAEEIYNTCMKIALKLKSIIGNEKLEKLRELFQDY